jgi:hypothetical protein
MEYETLKSELLRLFEEQSNALENEVFGGMSLLERKEYDRRTKRINELEIECAANEAAKKSSQSAKAEQKRQWSKQSETDTPQAEAHQPCRNREKDSKVASGVSRRKRARKERA